MRLDLSVELQQELVCWTVQLNPVTLLLRSGAVPVNLNTLKQNPNIQGVLKKLLFQSILPSKGHPVYSLDNKWEVLIPELGSVVSDTVSGGVEHCLVSDVQDVRCENYVSDTCRQQRNCSSTSSLVSVSSSALPPSPLLCYQVDCPQLQSPQCCTVIVET